MESDNGGKTRPWRPGGKYVLIALLAILALGAFARFHNLGDFSFWTDELYHIVAAQSMLESGEPVIPGKGVYWRAYPVTAITAFVFSHVGVSEKSARTPFVLINMLFLVILFAVLARIFSPTIALAVTFVLALAPNELRLAREVRMYGLFQLLYVTASFLFFYGLERKQWFRGGLFIATALLVLLVSASIQELTVNFALTLAAYCLVMGGYIAVKESFREALHSRYSLLLAALIVSAAAVLIVEPSLLSYFVAVAREKPAWDTHGDGLTYYSWFFFYNYPGFSFVYILGAVLLIGRYGRAGVFVVCSFIPLMIVHLTFFTGRVAERYISYIFPFFVIGVAGLFEPMYEMTRSKLSEYWREEARAWTIVLLLAILPVAYLFMHPWINEARYVTQWGMGPRWKEVSALIRDLSEDHVVITTWPREVLYYGGRFPDYILTQGYEFGGEENHEVQIGDHRVAVRYIRTSDQLVERIEARDRLCVIATDWSYANPDFLNDSIREVIESNLVPLRHEVDDRILIYTSP
jgi:hypothetical protein